MKHNISYFRRSKFSYNGHTQSQQSMWLYSVLGWCSDNMYLCPSSSQCLCSLCQHHKVQDNPIHLWQMVPVCQSQLSHQKRGHRHRARYLSRFSKLYFRWRAFGKLCQLHLKVFNVNKTFGKKIFSLCVHLSLHKKVHISDFYL